MEEGLAQLEQAVQIDPLSAWYRAMLGVTYLVSDANQSLTEALKAIRIDPDGFLAYWTQMTALCVLERYSEAAHIGEMGIRMFGRPVWMMASLTRCYSHLGRRADAEALYGELRSRAKREFVSPVFLAIAAYAAGEQDDAIRSAQYADQIGDPTLIGIRYWPDLAELRENPRFQDILKRRGWSN
jgi:tetratricopeptide (TPR) repeat protein